MRTLTRSFADITRAQEMEQHPSAVTESERKRFTRDLRQAMAALCCLTTAMVYQRLFPSQAVVAGFIKLIGVFIIGVPIALTAVRGFVQRELRAAMEILVTIAMLICLLNNEYTVALTIPLLLTLVHFLEEKSIIGGQDAINGLKKMQSTRAILWVDGTETETDARTLRPGDVIAVKPGMVFPIDGEVRTGFSSVNQQSLTGESLPCDVGQGSPVYAGTLNLQGSLTVRVVKAYEDTSFQKIVRTLEETSQNVTPESRLVDRFLAYYIPFVLIAATLVWILTQQIDRSVAILVVSCPCGHMLIGSAPLIASLAVAARRGVLIKGAGIIEKLTQANAILLDKTGTLTSGEIQTRGWHPAPGVQEETLREAALCVAWHSTHPICAALRACQQKPDAADRFIVQEESGAGLIGVGEGHTVLLGSEMIMRRHDISLNGLEGVTGMLGCVARDGAYLGAVSFVDTLRPDTLETIADLRAMGMERINLVTGDRADVAEAFRATCGLDEVYAQRLPEQKLQVVRSEMDTWRVVFVGDGVNDALALNAADIGIAMGAMGSDAAIQSADVALMNNRLTNIPFVIRLARTVRAVIRQNIFIAFSTSLVMMALAGLGILPALPGALLHNIGAFLVLLNSGRVLRMRLDAPAGETTPEAVRIPSDQTAEKVV
jgi:Cd2+/Zn2+-exporting ATPase/Cu+-exporting ATPase